MASTSYSFKNNLTVDNNKYLSWLAANASARYTILGLDSSNNINLNSAAAGSLYINSNNVASNTFINLNNASPVIVSSNLGVGLDSSSNLTSTITLPQNGHIGLNTTTATCTGFLGLAGSHVLSNTAGSRILLYGNDNTSGNAGQIHLFTGNNTNGSINLSTADDILRMQILSNGIINFSPNGSDVTVSLDNNLATITSHLIIENTDDATDLNEGCVQVRGGMSIDKDLIVGGNIQFGGNIELGSASYGNLVADTLSLGDARVFANSFSAQNNVSSPTNVTSLFYTNSVVQSFQLNISVSVFKNIGASLYEYFTIEGNQTQSGWTLYTSSVGDVSGITFSITSAGQIQYTSINHSAWISTLFKYYSTQIVKGTYNPEFSNNTSGTIFFDSIQINDTSSTSITSSSASLYVMGGAQYDKNIIIKDSTEATGLTTGSFTTLGGVSIEKSLYIGGPVLQIPTGNTDARPDDASNGFIRFNTETQQFEGYGVGNTWGSLGGGGVIDSDEDTKILAEEGPGVDDDNLRFLTAGVERMRLNSSGNLGIGTTSPGYTLHVDGNIFSSGDITAFSDIRYKENIQPLQHCLERVLNCRGVSFTRVDSGQQQLGFIAQELETVFPQLVSQDSLTGYKSVAYGNITSVLLECIKELHQHNSLLQQQFQEFKTQIQDELQNIFQEFFNNYSQ